MFQNWYLLCKTGLVIIADEEIYIEVVDQGTPWEFEVHHFHFNSGRCPEDWEWCVAEMEWDDIPF